MLDLYDNIVNHGTLTIAVSACLLGEHVRYDGREKRDSIVTETLARHFTLLPLCPEVAIGMGVPRNPIQLADDASDPRVIGSGIDGDRIKILLRNYAMQQSAVLSPVSAYIFKSHSPSCGVGSVPVVNFAGPHAVLTSGIYARELIEKLPRLPYIEETQLADPSLYAHFVERVFFYARWKHYESVASNKQGVDLFFTTHELQLASHDAKATAELKAGMVNNNGKVDVFCSEDFQLAMFDIINIPRDEATALDNLRTYTLAQSHVCANSESDVSVLVSILSNKNTKTLRNIAKLVNQPNYAYLSRQTLFNPGTTERRLRAQFDQKG